MASSENLVTVEQPWMFRQSFADSRVSDFYARENETVTRALQMSFTGGGASESDTAVSVLLKPETLPFQTPTISGGSESEAPASKRGVGLARKITKRKSRAKKGTTTTFIAADPANFRQMVQQVTGVKFGGLNGQLPVTHVLKPEPQRPIHRLQPSGGLPTLDTSSFLLNQTHRHQVGPVPASYLAVQPADVSGPPPATVATDGGSGGLDFNSLYNFPTLESWKVM